MNYILSPISLFEWRRLSGIVDSVVSTLSLPDSSEYSVSVRRSSGSHIVISIRDSQGRVVFGD
jgi:hypothetical protein